MDKIHQDILGILTLIGCSISTVGAVLTLIALLLTLRSRKKTIPFTTIFIMINLTSAVLLLDVMLLVSEAESVISSPSACQAIAIILHFAVFACFTWMMNDSLYICLAIAKVIKLKILRLFYLLFQKGVLDRSNNQNKVGIFKRS